MTANRQQAAFKRHYALRLAVAPEFFFVSVYFMLALDS